MKKAILKINYICNNNCYFCHARTKKNLNLCNINEIYDKIKQIKYKTDCIILSGGEPSINKDLIKISRLVKKEGLKLGIVTNARIVSKKKAFDTLNKLKLSHIYTTFHSHEKDVYEKITKVPGSFKQTVEGIKNLLLIDEDLLVNIVLVKDNIKNLNKTVSFLINTGVKNIKLSFVEPVEKKDIRHTPDIIFSSKKVKEVLEKFKGNDIGWDGFPLCLMAGHENKIKNLKTCNIQYISEAWENDFYESNEGNKIKTNNCKECKKREHCEGIYTTYLEYRKFLPIPYKDPHH